MYIQESGRQVYIGCFSVAKPAGAVVQEGGAKFVMVPFMLFLREINWTMPAFDVFEVWVMKGVRLEN